MLNTPGIYAISELEYHNDPCETVSLTASLAKILCSSSPLHCWTASPRLNPNYISEDREIFDLGRISHALMLQGIDHACVLAYPDWRSKEARQERMDCRATGMTPILAKHWDRVKAMVEAGKRQIAAHKEAKDCFTVAGKPELTLQWTDDHGVQCRSRVDWLRVDYHRLADYKATGTSVNPESIARYALSQGWDVQAAFYRRGVKAITGKDAEFFFVAQEDYEPYALCVIGMGPDFLWAGEQKVQHAIDIWAACLVSGEWDGYPDRVCYPSLPSFEETRITEQQLREAPTI